MNIERATCNALGLLTASLVMPVIGATALLAPTEGLAVIQAAGPPALVRAVPAQPDVAVQADAGSFVAWGGYLADYNPSDLNGGSRGFAPAGLTVNQMLPQPVTH